MREDADVFIFPSLHEEGGWAVGEAMAIGLPVVCLDRGGPPVIVGRGVPTSGETETVHRLAHEMDDALLRPRTMKPMPTIEHRREELIALLQGSHVSL